MWDLTLGQEIILIIAVVTVIAWFMGRTFCTSKEHQVRTSMKLLKKENKHLESLMVKKDKDINEITDQSMHERKRRYEMAQQYELSHTSLEHLTQTHKQTLQQLQNLQGYQIKFEQLSQHYDEQSANVINLKNTLEKVQEVLQNTKKLNQKQQHELSHTQVENKQMTQDHHDQIEQIANLNTSLKQAKKNLQNNAQLIKQQTTQLMITQTKNKQILQNDDKQVEQISDLKVSLKQTKKKLQHHEELLEQQTKQLLTEERKNKQLIHDHEVQLVKYSNLKKTFKQTQEKLNGQQQSLTIYQRDNQALEKEVKTYKILSTIG